MAEIPVPEGLGERGGAFWAATVEGYELADDEVLVLVEVCRLVDQLDEMAVRVRADGLVASGSAGQPVAHPLLAPLASGRALLAKLLAQLGLPDEHDEARVRSPASIQARRAAEARWAAQRERESRPLGRWARGSGVVGGSA